MLLKRSVCYVFESKFEFIIVYKLDVVYLLLGDKMWLLVTVSLLSAAASAPQNSTTQQQHTCPEQCICLSQTQVRCIIYIYYFYN